jgi:hypothetical protein
LAPAGETANQEPPNALTLAGRPLFVVVFVVGSACDALPPQNGESTHCERQRAEEAE